MGLFSGSDPIAAYDIDLGMHMVLCHGPCDELQEIKVGDRVVWTGSSTGGRVVISARGVFGDEGGIAGDVDILMGEPTQLQNDYLQSQLGTDISAFRGVMSAVLRQVYVGRSAYLKPWSWKVKRTSIQTDGSAQWYPAKANINGDMNPAHILRECITNTTWGLGYPTAQIDDADFTALADTLYAENFGLSLQWTNQEQIEEFIGRVMRHVDGRIYVHPRTGLFSTMLVRDGYDPAGLFVADESNILTMDMFERRGWGDAVNEVIVVYRDRETNTDQPVTLQDIGNVQVQGRVVSQTHQYPGISNESLALRVCQRDLRVLSAGLSHAKITVDRNAWEGLPGDPFKLSWAKYGIEEVVFRVAGIDTGTLTDGRIVVDIIEDVFGLPTGTYLGQQPTGWVSPNTAPAVAPYEQVKEATHWEVWQYVSAADIATFGSNFGFVVAHAVRPSGDALHYQTWSRVSPDAFDFETKGEFCPTAELTNAISFAPGGLTDAVLSIENGVNLSQVKIGGYAWIGNEAVAVKAVNEGNSTITVDRGVMDTVPREHGAASRVWFADGYLGIDDDLHAAAVTVDIKCLPTTSLGTLAIGSAATLQQVMNWRYQRPYPPGNLKFNAVAYPEAIEGELTVSWSHRDRTQQTDALHTQTEGNIGPEVGTTYNLRIYNEADTWVHTETGLTGTSYVYPLLTEIEESGLDSGGTGGGNYDGVINADSPTMYFRLGEATGPTASDETTNHDGTYQGTPVYSEPGLLANDADTCIQLDGAGEYINVPYHADFEVQRCAASCIITPDTLTGHRFIFHFGDNSSGGNQGYTFAVLSDGRLSIGTYDGTWKAATTVGSHVLIDTRYHLGVNIDCTEGNKEVEFFVEGQLVETIAFDAVLSGSSSSFKIGALKGTGIQQTLSGHLDEFAYWSDTRLSAARFLVEYNEMIGAGRLNDTLRIELESERDGLVSLEKHNVTVARAGYGLGYGNYYGGA